MLPKPMRLTKPTEFAAVLKSGRRAGTRQLSVHLLPPVQAADGGTLEAMDHSAVLADVGVAGLTSGRQSPARAGFVVSSKVGNSVVRHRVTRRLRAQIQPLLADLASGTDVVVRVFPPAATASSASIAADLRYAMSKIRPK